MCLANTSPIYCKYLLSYFLYLPFNKQKFFILMEFNSFVFFSSFI